MRSDGSIKSTSRKDNCGSWKCPIYMNDKKTGFSSDKMYLRTDEKEMYAYVKCMGWKESLIKGRS